MPARNNSVGKAKKGNLNSSTLRPFVKRVNVSKPSNPSKKPTGSTAASTRKKYAEFLKPKKPINVLPVLHLDSSQSGLMEQYLCNSLHLAALQGDVGEIRHCYERGFPSVDCQNSEESTPLMLAALFGHKAAVRELVSSRASKDKKDLFGQSAYDYTIDCPCMNRRRQMYSSIAGKDHYRDDCNLVAKMLGLPIKRHRCAMPRHPASLHKDYLSLQISGSNLSLTVPTSRWNYASINHKAFGVILQDGNLVPLSSAVSGWQMLDPRKNHPSTIIDNAFYTNEVLRISQRWKYTLPPRGRDRMGGDSKPGRLYASHVEKKLIFKYILDLLQLKYGEKDIRKLHYLRDTFSGLEVPVHISKYPCENCKGFARKAEEVTGIKFVFAFLDTKISKLSGCKCGVHPPNGNPDSENESGSVESSTASDESSTASDESSTDSEGSSTDSDDSDQTTTTISSSMPASKQPRLPANTRSVHPKPRQTTSIPIEPRKQRSRSPVSQKYFTSLVKEFSFSKPTLKSHASPPDPLTPPRQKRKVHSALVTPPESAKRARPSSPVRKNLPQQRPESTSKVNKIRLVPFAAVQQQRRTPKKDAARKSMLSLLEDDSVDLVQFKRTQAPSFSSNSKRLLR